MARLPSKSPSGNISNGNISSGNIHLRPRTLGLYYGITTSNQKEFRTMMLRFLKSVEQTDIMLKILSQENLKEFIYPAFTSKDVSPDKCYEWLEIVGDGMMHWFMSMYFARDRFPFLCNAEGVKILARLKINFGSKTTLAAFARKAGFSQYISASIEDREQNMESLEEDVFEAVLGAISIICDETYGIGTGANVCYSILKQLYDEFPIELGNLIDNKTKVKEPFDRLEVNSVYGRPEWKSSLDKETGIWTCNIILQNKIFATATADAKDKSEQAASAVALPKMKALGIHPKVSEYDERLLSVPKLGRVKTITPSKPLTEDDIKTMLETASTQHEGDAPSPPLIDIQIPTREKPKIFKKHHSTILTMCCRKRDLQGVKICLRMGANVTLLDSDGMSCIDLLLSCGKTFPNEESDEEIDNIREILKIICKTVKKNMEGADKTALDKEKCKIPLYPLVKQHFYDEYCKHPTFGIKFRKVIEYLQI